MRHTTNQAGRFKPAHDRHLHIHQNLPVRLARDLFNRFHSLLNDCAVLVQYFKVLATAWNRASDLH